MKVLYAPACQRVPSKAFEWSNGTYSLLLNATLELDFSLDDEDFTELLLDFAELLEATLELDLTLDEDSAELLDTLVLFSLDFGVTLDDDLTSLLEEDSSSMLPDDSSSRGAKLLSSSPHAAKNASTAPTANNLANVMFSLQIICLKYNQSVK